MRNRFLALCAVLAAVGFGLAVAHAQTSRLTGLSDNEGCPEATTEGQVVSRELTGKERQVEGFRFKDEFGTSYINVSLPEGMAKARKARLHGQLLEILKPKARLRVTVQGCGAAGRVEVLTSVTRL